MRLPCVPQGSPTTFARVMPRSGPVAIVVSGWPTPFSKRWNRWWPGDRLVVAIDDTPTPATARCVEGAGIHHNPTPGPGRREVRLRPRLGHAGRPGPAPRLGHRGPAPAGQPVRPPARTCAKLPPGVPLGVPHQAGAGGRSCAGWAAGSSTAVRGERWVVGRRGLRQAARSCGRPGAGVVVVSRLRKDAALWSRAPAEAAGPSSGAAGRPTARSGSSLAKRAGQQQRLAAGAVRAVRQGGGQDDQDVPGDLAAGRRA